MAMITISRELGSEGCVIAEQVAQTLGYRPGFRLGAQHWQDTASLGRRLAGRGRSDTRRAEGR
jgi:hypothetical protein